MPTSRIFLVSALAVALSILASAPADAGRRWCEADPVFLVAGTRVNVVTLIQEDDLAAVTGAIQVTLYVPDGVSAELVSTDAGYNGYGEVVAIIPVPWLDATKRGAEVVVEVVMPASRAGMPVLVRVSPDGGRIFTVSGWANSVISAPFMVRPVS